jgi:hypothetical protein
MVSLDGVVAVAGLEESNSKVLRQHAGSKYEALFQSGEAQENDF